MPCLGSHGTKPEILTISTCHFNVTREKKIKLINANTWVSMHGTKPKF